jgi:hypothetical protein
MKSACYFCPFNALKADAIERHKAHPEQVADALMLDNTPRRNGIFHSTVTLLARFRGWSTSEILMAGNIYVRTLVR